jgi:hypothetical protein
MNSHHFPNGYYDYRGNWCSTKHCFVYCGDCFVYCGDRCDCGPPFGVYYSEAYDVGVQTMKCAGAGIASQKENL